MNPDAFGPSGLFRWVLAAIGGLVVVWNAIAGLVHHDESIVTVAIVAVAVVSWVVLVVLPDRMHVGQVVATSIMTLAGATQATATDGVSLILVAVALVWCSRDLRNPTWAWILLSAIGIIAVLIGDWIRPVQPLGVLAMLGGILLAFFGSLSRRQTLVAEEKNRELLRSQVVIAEEQARADLLADRQRIAHDIHDVLAHSLGGLVMQLDAADALLENGDADGAATRVRDARALAREGLGEARRAVAALREARADTADKVAADALVDDLDALLTAHRSLGGAVTYSEAGPRHDLSGDLELALRRAAQEALTNARRHAPGRTVSMQLDWGPDDVALRIENELDPEHVDRTGGGHGLVGMRERFDSLPGGVATAAVESGAFVVRVGGATA